MTFMTSTRAPLRASTIAAPRPGVPGRIVGGAHQARLALDEHQRLALVEGVVAERDHIGARRQQLVADRLGDAEAAGRVLAVDDDEIELPGVAQAGQAVRDRVAAGAADDVAEEEKTHQVLLCSEDAGSARSRSRDDLAFRDDPVERTVMRFVGHRGHLLHREGDADGEQRLPVRQRAAMARS